MAFLETLSDLPQLLPNQTGGTYLIEAVSCSPEIPLVPLDRLELGRDQNCVLQSKCGHNADFFRAA